MSRSLSRDTYHAQKESQSHHLLARLDNKMQTKQQCPQDQRRIDEVLVANSLRNVAARPKRDQVAKVKDYKQVVVLRLGHFNVVKDTHGTGLRQSRLVQMDEECDPPCLAEKTPKVLLVDFLLQV